MISARLFYEAAGNGGAQVMMVKDVTLPLPPAVGHILYVNDAGSPMEVLTVMQVAADLGFGPAVRLQVQLPGGSPRPPMAVVELTELGWQYGKRP